jgi:hypothetical protein
MSKTVEQIVDEALALPTADKVLLADRLVASIGDSTDEVLHRNWATEAISRRDEVRNGEVQTIPKDEALNTIQNQANSNP